MIVGVLLAAGSATRFGGDKLLAELPDGRLVAEAACAGLRPAVDRMIAVVRPGAGALAARLVALGAEVSVFDNAGLGMGASLAHGVARASEADGWLIALADMPFVAGEDVARVAAALRAGAAIALPVAQQRRGHPVGFARRFAAELMALDGDEGARPILARHFGEIVEIVVDDPRRFLDVDTRDDLVARGIVQEGTNQRLPSAENSRNGWP